MQVKSLSSTKQTIRHSKSQDIGTLYILTIRSDLLSRMNPLADSRRHDSLLIRYPWESRLVYDVIAAIDIKGFAGDKLCRIVREEGGRDADVVDADEAASRSL
jgi:hypothetical protein